MRCRSPPDANGYYLQDWNLAFSLSFTYSPSPENLQVWNGLTIIGQLWLFLLITEDRGGGSVSLVLSFQFQFKSWRGLEVRWGGERRGEWPSRVTVSVWAQLLQGKVVESDHWPPVSTTDHSPVVKVGLTRLVKLEQRKVSPVSQIGSSFSLLVRKSGAIHGFLSFVSWF